MTELLRSWILGITAVSLLSSFAAALTEGAPGRQAVRLISALALVLAVLLPLRGYRPGELRDLVLAVLLPLRGYRPGELRDRFAAYERALDRETAYSMAGTDALLRRETGEALRRWVETRAAAWGISCQARVETVLRDGTAVPVSCTITVRPDTDGAAASALGREISAALGIEAVWIRGDEG